jgi:hypothetical protein
MISLERTKTRLDQLIVKGQEVLRTSNTGLRGVVWVAHDAFQEWSLGCRTFLERVFGESRQLGDFEKIVTIHQRDRVEKGLAILRAVKEDLEFGALGRLEELVSTAIYSDFLGMGETLLAQQQTELVDIAAFLAGAVLENGLRRIATNRDIKQKESDDISSLNQKLADGGVYNNLWRKKIDTWNAIRGNADHGRFGRNSPSDVQNMIAGVRDFLADFLSS